MENFNQIRSRLLELSSVAKETGKETSDPAYAALCETTHEVLVGLETAYKHYKEKSEEAWKKDEK